MRAHDIAAEKVSVFMSNVWIAASSLTHSSLVPFSLLSIQQRFHQDKMAAPTDRSDMDSLSGPGRNLISLSSGLSTGSEATRSYSESESRSEPSLAMRSLRERYPYKIALPRPKPNFFSKFISSRGNEYFCEIDEEYLTDRFNLTGLNTEVAYYQYALDLVTDVFDLDADDDLREQIEKSARHLYGLVHARYIVTTRGLAKMVRSYCSYAEACVTNELSV